MNPTLCPNRVRELIRLVNLPTPPDDESSSNRELRTQLQTIARAFRANRRGEKSTNRIIQIETRHQISISLSNGTVETSSDELALALAQIQPTGKIDLIRECPVCSEIFWAGRSDKEACDKHSAAWRKQEQRRRDRERKEERARKRAKRLASEVAQPIKLNKTTASILDAINEHCRTFKTIDDYCYMWLQDSYVQVNVRAGLRSLVERGILASTEPTKGKIRFTPTEKLARLRRELLPPEGEARSFRKIVKE